MIRMYPEAGRIAVGFFSDVKVLTLEAETHDKPTILVPANVGYSMISPSPPLISYFITITTEITET